MKTAIFLSVREKATRFPKKVLKEICGKSVTALLIERLKASEEADVVVLTTSTHPDDQVLVEIASNNDILSFKGSEEDKLERYMGACETYGIDFCLIVDGDDILISTEYIDTILKEAKSQQYDFISCDGLPLGMNTNAMSYSALKRVCLLKADANTEVWGGYFKDHNLFKTKEIVVPEAVNRPLYRLTLDYEEDFWVFEKIFNALYRGKYITTKEVVDYLDQHPEIVELNQEAQKRYEAHLIKSTIVKFKE